jgi:DNA-binding beta-propeller fold protein YncE
MKPISYHAAALGLAVLAAACGGSSVASVAVNPVSGRVFVTHDDSLQVCDQAAQNCTKQRLTQKPVSAAVGPDGGLVFLTASSIYRCDETGQACRETRLPMNDAVSVAVAASGAVIAVSASGDVAVCDNAGCQKAAR